jgi:hypothetical protein
MKLPLTLAILLCTAGTLSAQTPVPAPSYLAGGVGEEERADMLAQRAQYTLRLGFAERRSGAFRADVSVRIEDAGGRLQLALDQAGPWVYVQLPPGSYRVSASAGGVSQQRQVRLPGGAARELMFYWEAPAGSQP